ncbi:MAG TPA: hypothetical protein VFF03_03830 [Rhodocyclaceae bacterium]|nr:hypothetical protein [Rhodocyclaceae bacterium]
MALSPRQRWTLLGGALAVTVGLVIWSGEEPEEAAVPQGNRPAPAARSSTAPAPAETTAKTAPADPGSLRLSRSDLRAGGGEIRDIFPKESWYVPPPPPPPGPPQPPELPFTYLGRLVDRGRITVYLEDEDDRNLAVRQGDVINGVYRVKRITPEAVTFVYLPMHKQQTLEIGSIQ